MTFVLLSFCGHFPPLHSPQNTYFDDPLNPAIRLLAHISYPKICFLFESLLYLPLILVRFETVL